MATCNQLQRKGGEWAAVNSLKGRRRRGFGEGRRGAEERRGEEEAGVATSQRQGEGGVVILGIGDFN